MPIFFIPIIALIINNFLKFFVQSLNEWKINIKWLYHTWKMPSWHAAFCSSALVLVFLIKWFNSLEFIIIFIIYSIIIHDAIAVRQNIWKQAVILNKIQSRTRFNEVIWHNYSELIVWTILWIMSSYAIYETWFFYLS